MSHIFEIAVHALLCLFICQHFETPLSLASQYRRTSPNSSSLYLEVCPMDECHPSGRFSIDRYLRTRQTSHFVRFFCQPMCKQDPKAKSNTPLNLHRLFQNGSPDKSCGSWGNWGWSRWTRSRWNSHRNRWWAPAE
ncbi:hypothetical protein BJ875DRAFT_45127 [Amylocarpus encephaloides]|uniref:Secreted protein n=1 Tax=Amylocarpus encephaloides TaxID=45428 RepID=A0A9P7YH80_9HELO|nr:hypothetical protein BJ875DRAFT_45127 [Amylocarpus encephaloides]